MSEVKIYHNPRCSKSRATLELIQQQGVEPEIIRYLDTPLAPIELENLLYLLEVPIRKMMRTKEPEYKTLKLDDESLSDAALINAIAKHPKLLERPIVVRHDRAVISRPPELVLELFN